MMATLRTALLAVLLLAGCASLGLQEAKSFSDRIAYAEGVNTAIRDASTDALNAHSITSADMEHVMAINAQAKALLASARSLQGTDVQTAEGKLLTATKLLTELQTWLRARGVKTSQEGLWAPMLQYHS